MKWFEGSIAEGIQKSKRNKTLFVVSITGADDESKAMEKTWDHEGVCSLLEESNSICLQFKANSPECAQFSVIYPVICVPCTFFIGDNGQPLEVVGGCQDPETFQEKIRNAIKAQDKSRLENQQMTKNDIEGQEITQEPADQPPLTEQGEPIAGTSETPEHNLSLNERTELAKKKLAAIQAEKEKKKKEDEVEKEKQRIEQGKGIARLQQWKKEQEMKQSMNEYKKEKEEARLARERVKKQIEQDRADRASKFNKEKEDRLQKLEEKNNERAAAKSEAEKKTQAERMEHSRIQFRLPNGQSVTQQFSSHETLSTAHDYLKQTHGGVLGSFRMASLYPRYEYTQEDMSKTMLELGLAPSAAIVILPGGYRSSSGPSQASSNIFSQIYNAILLPFTWVWGMITTFVLPSSQPITGTQRTQSTMDAASNLSSSARRTNRPKTAVGMRTRKEASGGNIHRLADNSGEDEDSNTWNGNSTQQM